jgi:hypothetical protein
MRHYKFPATDVSACRSSCFLLKMEAERSSQTSVIFYRIIRQVPEDNTTPHNLQLLQQGLSNSGMRTTGDKDWLRLRNQSIH